MFLIQDIRSIPAEVGGSNHSFEGSSLRNSTQAAKKAGQADRAGRNTAAERDRRVESSAEPHRVKPSKEQLPGARSSEGLGPSEGRASGKRKRGGFASLLDRKLRALQRSGGRVAAGRAGGFGRALGLPAVDDDDLDDDSRVVRLGHNARDIHVVRNAKAGTGVSEESARGAGSARSSGEPGVSGKGSARGFMLHGRGLGELIRANPGSSAAGGSLTGRLVRGASLHELKILRAGKDGEVQEDGDSSWSLTGKPGKGAIGKEASLKETLLLNRGKQAAAKGAGTAGGAELELVNKDSSEASEASDQGSHHDKLRIQREDLSLLKSSDPAPSRPNLSSTPERVSLRSFQERAIPEIVQRSAIIVRQGGDGEIRLVLKPEHLGQVRIRVSIVDNAVEGRIVVENNSVRELFENSLDHLRGALKSQGFETAGLEVSVGNRGEHQGEEAFPQGKAGRITLAAEEEHPRIYEFQQDALVVNLVI